MHITKYSLYVCLFLWIYNPVCGEAAHVCTLSSPVLSYWCGWWYEQMPCTLSKIDTMIFFALHLCLLCCHGNPVVWWSSPHYEKCQIMLLIFWTYSLFSNLKLDGIDSTIIIFVYPRAKHVISLLALGWYAWWHAQVCWRLWDKPNIYCSKEGKTSWR